MWRLFSVLLFPITLSAQLKRFEYTQSKMGSPFRIVFYHHDSAFAGTLAKDCFRLVDTLNSIFSDYDRQSESSSLNTSGRQVSRELFSMIKRSKQAWLRSGRTFDITIGALTKLWRRAKAAKSFPSAEEVNKAKAATGFDKLRLDPVTRSVSFLNKELSLDFGGIVKGYAAQKVIDFLKKKGIMIALADAGGDIAIGDPPPGHPGWIIGINLPETDDELMKQKLELRNCAVATSGDLYNYMIRDGKKYSHIIDPRTGYGVTSQRNVTVIANDGATADWLATACSILPIDKALALARKENAALLIATLKNEKIVIHKTADFDHHFQKQLP